MYTHTKLLSFVIVVARFYVPEQQPTRRLASIRAAEVGKGRRRTREALWTERSKVKHRAVLDRLKLTKSTTIAMILCRYPL